MQPPPAEPPTQPMMSPPKKGMGCWAWGAIIAVVLVLVCGGGCLILGKAAMDSPEFRKGFEQGMERSRARQEGRTVPTTPTNAPVTN